MVNHNQSYEPESKKKAESDPKLAFYEKLSSKKVEAKQKSVAMGMSGREKGPEQPSAKSEAPAGMERESFWH